MIYFVEVKVKQQLWQTHKDDYTTEGYVLDDIFEIDLPFWQCKQNIVVEKDIEIDRFSAIILRLVDSGVRSYSDICAVLGIEEDSFVTIQFHYLLKNNFLRELAHDTFALTLEGRNFIDKRNGIAVKKMETEEFEFLMMDLQNDLSGAFFDPQQPIDKNWSSGKKKNFSGYRIIQSHRKQQRDGVKEIEHKHKPTYATLVARRAQFTQFYNTFFKEKSFYDFADEGLQQHKRNIRFLALLFKNEQNDDDIRVNILQYNQTLNKFSGQYNEENTLSKLVTQYWSSLDSY